MNTVYIALGSNVGDREASLHQAIRLLGEKGVRVVKPSSFYETEPVDYLDQQWFINAVMEASTDLGAQELLVVLRQIEFEMGSQKPFPKGPRLIDLDVLLFGDETIDAPNLQVPHPRMLERNFVLVPLAEIAGDYKHPSWTGTVQQILERTQDRSVVRKKSL